MTIPTILNNCVGRVAILALAVGFTAVLSPTSAQGAMLPTLGTAANFTLLSVPGSSDWNLSLVTVNGNIGIGNVGANNGKVNNMAPSVITGNVYTTVNTGQYSGPGTIDGSVIVNATLVNQAITDAMTAETTAAALAPTQTITGNVGSATTLTGNGGLNVIDITGNITSTLALNGGPNDVWVVNVAGTMNLGGSDFIGAAGTTPQSNVLLNFTGTGSLMTHVGNDIKGTLLMFGYTGTFDGSFDAIYGGNGGTINLMSGAVVHNVSFAPEPGSLGLLALGAGLLVRRRRRN